MARHDRRRPAWWGARLSRADTAHPAGGSSTLVRDVSRGQPSGGSARRPAARPRPGAQLRRRSPVCCRSTPTPCASARWRRCGRSDPRRTSIRRPRARSRTICSASCPRIRSPPFAHRLASSPARARVGAGRRLRVDPPGRRPAARDPHGVLGRRPGRSRMRLSRRPSPIRRASHRCRGRPPNRCRPRRPHRPPPSRLPPLPIAGSRGQTDRRRVRAAHAAAAYSCSAWWRRSSSPS